MRIDFSKLIASVVDIRSSQTVAEMLKETGLQRSE